MTTFKTTWHHIRRSPFQSLTAIIIMVFSFFTLSTFAVVSNGLSSILNFFETKPEVTIFLKDGLDLNTVENIQKNLASYPSVKEINFISKEKALGLYKEQNKDNPLLTEMVTASILPASFEVKVSDPKTLETIAQEYATKTNLVDEIIYQKDIIKSILNWTDIVRKSGIVSVLIIGLVGFLTIFAVIGMKITNRKEEIRISRLLGASYFYVKKPFLLEGIIYGLFGSLVGSVLSFGLITFFSSKINGFFQPVTFITSNINFYALVLVSEIFLGIVLGFLASWIGVKRYIKF